MKKTPIYLIIGLLCFALVPLHVAESVEIPSISDKISELELPNGLKIVVVERHNAPVFFAMMTFRVGSTIEDSDLSGLSHFMEHMLFKGSKTFGTTNYKKEVPIMNELDRLALRMRDLQVASGWRFQMFEDFSTETRANLPLELRERHAEDDAYRWRQSIEILSAEDLEFPDKWSDYPWIFEEDGRNFWKDYLEVLDIRSKMAELIKKQREYIVQSSLDEVYKMNGAVRFNAYTSFDETAYLVGLPSNALELWMQLESDRFINPVFREFYPEREVIQEELRMREATPTGKMYQNLLSSAFRAHPYGRPIIGWLSDIQITLRDDMAEHYRRYYAPNNCQIILSGSVNPDEVFKLARKYFGKWKPAEVAHEVKVIEPPQEGERRTYVEFDAEPQFMAGYRVPTVTHPDWYALSMMTQVLSSGRTSRFYRNIFEKGLTSSAPGAWIGPSQRYPGLFIVSAVPRSPHSVDEIENIIYEEIEKLANEPVNEWELERIRNMYMRLNFDRLRNNQWIAFTLNSAYVTYGDWRPYEMHMERMLSVTPEDIQRVAKIYFDPKNRTVVNLIRPSDANSKGNNNGIIETGIMEQ